MNQEFISKLIYDHFFANYTFTPFRQNAETTLYNPAIPATPLDVVNAKDFVEVAIFPQNTDRRIINAQDKGRWVEGFVRVNAYYQYANTDTKTNEIATGEILSKVDAIWSEKIISDVNAQITFQSGSVFNVGLNEDYRRYESYMVIRFTGMML